MFCKDIGKKLIKRSFPLRRQAFVWAAL